MSPSTERAFLDANIPIYAFGKPSLLREPCQRILRDVVRRPGTVVTSAEVLQEILHIYVRRQEAAVGRRIVDRLANSFGAACVGVGVRDILRAAAMDVPLLLQARDRVHLAVMQRHGITRIISAGRAFDHVLHITRLDPALFPEWRLAVFPGRN